MFATKIKALIGPKLLNTRFLFSAPLAYAPGHFYSPICDPAELKKYYRDPSTSAELDALPGIDLSHDKQLALWDSWDPYLAEGQSFLGQDASARYRLPSNSYDIGDALIYFCMLRSLNPSRLIEIGSGSSSAVALDTFERFFTRFPECTFIEPYPALLRSLLKPGDEDKIKLIESGVQRVPSKYFSKLSTNDILFIDSTHIVKTCSDVVYELFDILPKLNSGVVVHFHDVFYPFEYPRDWVLSRNYSWNEIYALRAFLMGNQDWEIMFFNDYFARAETARVKRDAPRILDNPGGGLWLRRR